MSWAREWTAAANRSASGPASNAGHHGREQEISRQEPRSANPARSGRVRERGVSSCHLLVWRCIAVELAEQSIAVSLGRLGKLLDEAFDLLAGGVFEGFGSAEVDGVGFHQLGIEPVLANDLAETVADFVTGTVAVSIATAGRGLM